MNDAAAVAILDGPIPATSDLGDETIVRRLATFLTGQLRQSTTLERFVRFPGGLSWITAGFTLRTEQPHALNGRAMIVKIGSPAGLLAPYSSHPQALALNVFADSAVPVPRLHWYSDDLDILGAPFLISDKVSGDELNPFVRGYGVRDLAHLKPLGRQFADMLADVHSFDWQRAGIGGLQGETQQSAAGCAQVDFWDCRIQHWAAKPYPLLDFAAVWLRRHHPALPFVSIVHGDYRVGNFLASEGNITTILDWEMVHLGDPHEDLCWAMLPELGLRGLIPHEEFLERYQARSGIRVQADSLRYYEIFTLYKMAAINMGGIAGLEAGSKDLRLACMGFNVPAYLSRLGKALELEL